MRLLQPMTMAAALALALALALPARAETDHATRATFLRAGPGLDYEVTDEVDHGAALNVLRCAGEWCEARYEGVVGWVPAGTVAQAVPALAAPHGTQPCFEDRQAGYGKGERTRFCPR